MGDSSSIDFFPSAYDGDEYGIHQQPSTHGHVGPALGVMQPNYGGYDQTGFGGGYDQPSMFVPQAGDLSRAINPGLTGTMDTGMGSGQFGDFENEPPLLDELGIDPHAIKQKVMAVLNPKTELDEKTLHDEDIVGPFLISIALGGVLLLGGKLHFGYLMGYMVGGSVAIKLLLSLMADVSISVYHTMSVLGYCLMPMVVLAVSCLFFSANTGARFLIMSLCIAWSTHSASSMFVRVLRSHEQMILFMYPICLLYACFAMIVMF